MMVMVMGWGKEGTWLRGTSAKNKNKSEGGVSRLKTEDQGWPTVKKENRYWVHIQEWGQSHITVMVT